MGISDKVPPQNIDAEQSVLGAMLLDKDAVINVAGVLKPEFFYQQANADIYDSILELFEESMPIDIVTLADKLSAKKKLILVIFIILAIYLLIPKVTSFYVGDLGGTTKTNCDCYGIDWSVSSCCYSSVNYCIGICKRNEDTSSWDWNQRIPAEP